MLLSPAPTPERTIAILRGPKAKDGPGVVDHEFRKDIESRILEAEFNVVDERMVDGNKHGLEGLGDGPNIVLLLEREKRAVKVWQELLGGVEDQKDQSSTLRALYGSAVWAPSSLEQARIYIATLFPSFNIPKTPTQIPTPEPSPTDPTRVKRVFTFDDSQVPPSPLPSPQTNPVFLAPVSSDRRKAVSEMGSHDEFEGEDGEEEEILEDFEGEQEDDFPPRLARRVSTTSSVASGPSVTSSTASSSFRARLVPSTQVNASIEPRMSRAALLRMGIDPGPARTREVTPPEEREKDFITPGVNQRPLEFLPKSISTPPSVVPRATRSSLLRSSPEEAKNKDSAPTMRRVSSGTSDRAAMFDAPGYKRRESIMVASTQAPSIAPRQTKASALRTGGRPLSVIGRSESFVSQTSSPRQELSAERHRETFEGIPGHKRTSIISVSSTRAPSIVPRPNRSAALRAAGGGASPSSTSNPSVPFFANLTRTSSSSTVSTVKSSRSGSASASGAGAGSRGTDRSSPKPGSRPGSVLGRLPSEDPAATLKARKASRRISQPIITPTTNKSATLRASKSVTTSLSSILDLPPVARTLRGKPVPLSAHKPAGSNGKIGKSQDRNRAESSGSLSIGSIGSIGSEEAESVKDGHVNVAGDKVLAGQTV